VNVIGWAIKKIWGQILEEIKKENSRVWWELKPINRWKILHNTREEQLNLILSSYTQYAQDYLTLLKSVFKAFKASDYAPQLNPETGRAVYSKPSNKNFQQLRQWCQRNSVNFNEKVENLLDIIFIIIREDIFKRTEARQDLPVQINSLVENPQPTWLEVSNMSRFEEILNQLTPQQQQIMLLKYTFYFKNTIPPIETTTKITEQLIGQVLDLTQPSISKLVKQTYLDLIKKLPPIRDSLQQKGIITLDNERIIGADYHNLKATEQVAQLQELLILYYRDRSVYSIFRDTWEPQANDENTSDIIQYLKHSLKYRQRGIPQNDAYRFDMEKLQETEMPKSYVETKQQIRKAIYAFISQRIGVELHKLNRLDSPTNLLIDYYFLFTYLK
jgi:hypothetical protein